MSVALNSQVITECDSIAVLRSVHLRHLNLYRLAQSIEDPIPGLNVFCVLPVLTGKYACRCCDCHAVTVCILYGYTDTQLRGSLACDWISDT